MCSSAPNVGKRKALLIGIGDDGSGQPLPGPRNDTLKMKKLLIENYMYKKTDIVVIHDKQRIAQLVPTKENILREIDNLVRDCQAGDRFVFHYSGHTGQQANLDGTEVDGLDERIETLTGPILDDELRARLVNPLCSGSQLVAVLDSCHSATLLDLPHVECHLPKSFVMNETPKEYARVALADLKQPLGQYKNRLVRQPSSSKQPRAKKPRLTLDTVTGSTTQTFKSSGPLTSILPRTHSFFSPLSCNDDASAYATAKEGIDTHSSSPLDVDFYGEHCCECPLLPRDQIEKDKSELPRVVAISSCKDSQVSYDDGNRMTKVLCSYLRANPNPSLQRLFNGISFSLFNPAYKRAKSERWMEWARKCQEGSLPNAYQHPSLSSLQRLNPNYKFSL